MIASSHRGAPPALPIFSFPRSAWERRTGFKPVLLSGPGRGAWEQEKSRRARRRRAPTLCSCPKGFTLIELVAVIALISLMLFFTMPNFQSAMGDQESKKASRRLMATIQELKEKALAERKLYVLHINLDAGKMWESNEALSEDAVPEKQDQGYEFPEGLKILDVEYPVKGKVSTGVADICFYKEGYSDKALIHIEDEDNEQMTFLVESFLSKIKIYDSYASFED